MSGRGKKWDMGPLTDDQRELAERYMPAVECWSARVKSEFPHIKDDITNQGYVALCLAARNYDPARYKFNTYLKYHLMAARSELLRASRPQGYRLGRVAPLTFTGLDSRSEFAVDERSDQSFRSIDDRDELGVVMSRLRKIDRNALTLPARKFAKRHRISEVKATVARRLAREKVAKVAAELTNKMEQIR